jgi:hypothetical protein
MVTRGWSHGRRDSKTAVLSRLRRQCSHASAARSRRSYGAWTRASSFCALCSAPPRESTSTLGGLCDPISPDATPVCVDRCRHGVAAYAVWVRTMHATEEKWREVSVPCSVPSRLRSSQNDLVFGALVERRREAPAREPPSPPGRRTLLRTEERPARVTLGTSYQKWKVIPEIESLRFKTIPYDCRACHRTLITTVCSGRADELTCRTRYVPQTGALQRTPFSDGGVFHRGEARPTRGGGGPTAVRLYSGLGRSRASYGFRTVFR